MKNTNIFDLLGISHLENFHSRFIVSVINYNNDSKRLFIEMLNKHLTNKITPVLNDTKGKNEHSLKNNLGRVDIFINDYKDKTKDGKTRIIIENKIFARDQKGQLARYSEYLETKVNDTNKYKGYLFYLTLEGRKASVYSTKNSNVKYYILSYRNDILANWLNKVLDLNIDEKLRGYISDYIEIVNKLTLVDEMIEYEFEKALKLEKFKDKGIEEKYFNAYLELKFWQYIENKLNVTPDPKRLYNYEKIKKLSKNQRKYGIIIGNKRIYVDINTKQLFLSKGKFNNENKNWIIDSEEKDIKLKDEKEEFKTDKLLNKNRMEEIANKVVENFDKLQS